MKYGQEFRFGYTYYPAEKRMKMIADAGFDGIMTWGGHRFEKRDGTTDSVVKHAKDCGLEIFAIHASFWQCSRIWGEDEHSKWVLDRYIKNVEDCSRFGCENLVVHVSNDDKMPNNLQGGFENFAKLFKKAEEEGVNIALENTTFVSLNKLLWDTVKSPRFKACFDSGHDNIMSDSKDYLDHFKGQFVVTHLHDNYANAKLDSHFLIGDGDVDFAQLALKLKDENLNAICLESRNSVKSIYGQLSAEEFLAESLRQVKKFF